MRAATVHALPRLIGAGWVGAGTGLPREGVLPNLGVSSRYTHTICDMVVGSGVGSGDRSQQRG